MLTLGPVALYHAQAQSPRLPCWPVLDVPGQSTPLSTSSTCNVLVEETTGRKVPSFMISVLTLRVIWGRCERDDPRHGARALLLKKNCILGIKRARPQYGSPSASHTPALVQAKRSFGLHQHDKHKNKTSRYATCYRTKVWSSQGPNQKEGTIDEGCGHTKEPTEDPIRSPVEGCGHKIGPNPKMWGYTLSL